MAMTFDIGGTALEVACPPNVQLHVEPGQAVSVKNVAGPTLKHYVGGFGSTFFTTAAGATNTHTGGATSAHGAVVLVPAGRTTITVTGPGY